MLDLDTLASVEGDSLALFSMAKADPSDPPDFNTLCRRLIGSFPQRVRMVGRGDLYPGARNRFTLRVHAALPREVALWVAAHELAHWYYIRVGFSGPHAELEARCDALGACIVAPRPLFVSAMRTHGHRVYRLAKAFHTTQSLAALRIGETTGRPVLCLRPRGAIVRGEPFGWPDGPGIAKAIRNPPASVHPIRLDDSFGLMARVG
jgi:hypothetical protein